MTISVPHNQHTVEAYQCEELALMFRRLGREVEAKFWTGVRDAKFNDAIKSDSRTKARPNSVLVHGNSGDRALRSAVRDTAAARDNGMSNGSTTKDSTRAGHTRK